MSELEFYQVGFQHPSSGINYLAFIHAPDTGETACVDAGNAALIKQVLAEKGWTLTHLWITHHHVDHVEGLEEVKAATGCKVIGPKIQSQPIAGLDVLVEEGDTFNFGGHTVEILQTPGHTLDMVNYYIPSAKTVFTGDTLFSIGCGKIFEGTAEMMWNSLSKLAALPADTTVYSSHEYTEGSAKFALTVDPDNTALQTRARRVFALRAEGKPTVPSMMSEEVATNPFLRAGDSAIRARLGMQDATDAEVFAEIRKRKDNF